MGKSTHFLGQPILGQLLNYLNRAKILQISRDGGGERYVKRFNAWCHLTVMLYAVISRFDSLREITSATMMECRKLQHLGIMDLPRRSTLSDANSRRGEGIFGKIYMDLYQTYKDRLSSDSPSHKVPKWMKRLQIIDSTTVSLFSNLIFKGVGRNPKTGKKKGGIKVHSVIHANEGVPCDIQFTSAAKHDHFLLAPDKLTAGDILAMDRAYIDYEKFEQMTQRGVIYVTKMKQNLTYETLSSTYYMNEKGQMQWREEFVVFRKEVKAKETDETGRAKGSRASYMGDTHRQSAAYTAAERSYPCMEFFRTCDHRQDYADVLHRCHGLPRTPGKGLGGGFGGSHRQSPRHGIE